MVGVNLWNFRPVIADMHEILHPADVDFWSMEVSAMGEGLTKIFYVVGVNLWNFRPVIVDMMKSCIQQMSISVPGRYL